MINKFIGSWFSDVTTGSCGIVFGWLALYKLISESNSDFRMTVLRLSFSCSVNVSTMRMLFFSGSCPTRLQLTRQKSIEIISLKFISMFFGFWYAFLKLKKLEDARSLFLLFCFQQFLFFYNIIINGINRS